MGSLFIGCFIGGRLLRGVCLTYSRQRPERCRMAIAEGRRLGGFLCPYAERTYGALRLPEITLSGFSRSVFRLFAISVSFLPGCTMSSAVFASSPVASDLFGQSVGNDRKALFRSFALCFQDFFGCRKFRFYLIPGPPECPQDEASDGGGQCQPTAGLPSPPAGSGGDDAGRKGG